MASTRLCDESPHPSGATKRQRLARWLRGHGIEIGAMNRKAHYLDWAQNVDKDPQAEVRARQLDEMDYSIHFHVWRPDTFLEFLQAAKRAAGLEFELAAFAPPESAEDNEFILILLKGFSRELRLPQNGQQPSASGRPSRWRAVRARVKQSPAGP